MGAPTQRFGLLAKVTAKSGQRDALAEYLLQAARLLESFDGCETYIVNLSSAEPDTIVVTEVWHSEADHDASLELESMKPLIAQARPLVAAFESTRLIPVGGKGIPPL